MVQWLGMFWLHFGRCFHSTWWNVSCLACVLWEKKRKKHILTWKLYNEMNAKPFIRFHIPINTDLTRRGSCKGQNHNTNKMSPKFLLNIILCAQPPDSITSDLQENNTQTLWLVHDVQMLMWLVWDTYPNAKIWLVQDTYPNATIWLVRATYYSTR